MVGFLTLKLKELRVSNDCHVLHEIQKFHLLSESFKEIEGAVTGKNTLKRHVVKDKHKEALESMYEEVKK